MTPDELIDKQEESLSTLRAKIQERKRLAEEEANTPQIYEKQARKLVEVPIVDILPDEDGVFNYERFIQLQGTLDAVYSNFLVVKDGDDIELLNTTIKLLVQMTDKYLEESLKSRI